MTHYDDEENIINYLQFTPLSRICFIKPRAETFKFFLSLKSERKFKNWINSSGKDDLPPDFYSDKYKFMLEVMRTDDYREGYNSPNALESRRVKEVEDMLRANGSPSLKESNIQLFIIPDMSKASENGYGLYVENFKRIVQKHIKKIEKYRNNHPEYKLGFMIFDEAPAYFEPFDKTIKPKAGEAVIGLPHFHFKDKNLIDSFYNADVDFIIWITPFKDLPGNIHFLPQICVFDMKRIKQCKMQLLDYKEDDLICMEVE